MWPLLKGLQKTLLRVVVLGSCVSLEVLLRPFPSQVLCGIEAQTSLEARQPWGKASSTTFPWQQDPVVLSSLELAPTSRSL